MFSKEKVLTLSLGLLLICGAAQPSHATDYYVASGVSSGNGDSTPAVGADAAGRGSQATPFRTIQYAVKQAGAGDKVLVRNGVYNEHVIIGYDSYHQNFVTTATGTGDADSTRIIIRAENLPSSSTYHAFIKASSTNDNVYGKFEYYAACFTVASADARAIKAVSPSVNFADIGGTIIGYVTIQGFDVTNSAYNGAGIVGKWTHHVKVLNNYVHGCGDGGIGMNQCDYSTISQNTVTGNCRTSSSGGSGISLLRSVAYDAGTSYHNEITQNKVFDNYILPTALAKYGETTLAKHTDGNGIIIDTCPFANTKTLIQNNVAKGNGGPGILLDAGNNIDILNNTCYKNNVDLVQTTKNFPTNRGEIELQQTVWDQDRSEYNDANGALLWVPNTTPPNSQELHTPSNPLNAVCNKVNIWGNVCWPSDNFTTTDPRPYNHNFYGVVVQDTTTNSSIKNNWLFKTGFTTGLAFASPRMNVTNFPDVTTLSSTTAMSNNYGGDLTGSDPLFASRTAFNFHLTAGSPCIGLSTYSKPNFDFDGFARYTDGKYDLGAFEFH